MVMEGCTTREWLQKAESSSSIILHNEHALAPASDKWREGHCVVYPKRHVIRVSGNKETEGSNPLIPE